MSGAADVDLAAIQRHVAERVKGLGGNVDPDDVSVFPMDEEVAPGIVAFTASYQGQGGQMKMTGIVEDGTPNTFPLEAVGKVFDKWLSSGGLPPAARAAEVITLIQSSGDRQKVVTTQAEVDGLAANERAVARVPTLIEVQGQPGVEFWLLSRQGLERRRVTAKPKGGAAIEDRTVADVIKAN